MKKRQEEPENHERWLVSYADFITLLFAFFVVMFATSNNDVQKQKEFEKSVRVNLHLASGSASSEKPDAGAVIAEYLQGQGLNGTSGAEGETYPNSGSSAEAADFARRYLGKSFDKETMKDSGLEVRHDAIGVRVSLAASSVFPAGEHKMKRSALDILNKLGELLEKTNKKVIIEGHTDDQPVKSESGITNWELASLRATSVVRYLIKSKDIDSKRMAAISYADQKPLVPNDSEENRAKNRRIEVLIVTQEETP